MRCKTGVFLYGLVVNVGTVMSYLEQLLFLEAEVSV